METGQSVSGEMGMAQNLKRLMGIVCDPRAVLGCWPWLTVGASGRRGGLAAGKAGPRLEAWFWRGQAQYSGRSLNVSEGVPVIFDINA
jgi:hypothetical protein